MDDTDAAMETMCSRSLSQLDVHCGASKASVQTETKLLKWLPYKIEAVQQLFTSRQGSRKSVLQAVSRLDNQWISQSKTHFLSLVLMVFTLIWAYFYLGIAYCSFIFHIPQTFTFCLFSCICKTAKRGLSGSSRPSVRPHGTTQLPQDGFSGNFIFEYF